MCGTALEKRVVYTNRMESEIADELRECLAKVCFADVPNVINVKCRS